MLSVAWIIVSSNSMIVLSQSVWGTVRLTSVWQMLSVLY